MNTTVLLFGMLPAAFMAAAVPVPLQAQTEAVQITWNGLRLNGNLADTADRSRPVFLILHGTWAHRDMEIIQDMQALLAESGAASLAVTLSLGLDDRKGFLPCDSPIRALHDQAVEELRAWRNHLLDRGWQEIVLLAHSRGGSQASLYQQRYNDPAVRELDLLAPMVWDQEKVRDDYLEATGADLAQFITRARQHPADDLMVPKLLNCESVRTTAEAFLSYYDRLPEKNTPTILAGFDTPTHVYLGTEDPLSRRFESAYRGGKPLAHVMLHSIDGADHFFRDFYLIEFSEDVLARWQATAP